jgi:hypothetical protein
MLIFRRIFLSNYWWQKSDICSQASYRYPILWEAFFDPSDSYFLFAEERGYHRWVLAHSSSCYIYSIVIPFVDIGFLFFFLYIYVCIAYENNLCIPPSSTWYLSQNMEECGGDICFSIKNDL